MEIGREQQLKQSFRKPPPGYGIVPFYWWLGDPVTKEKLLYHLEQLEGYSVSGLQINYAHSDRGGNGWGLTYPGEPAVFSEEWWELVGFFLQEAKKRGIAVSLSDYTLGSPGQGYYADEILQENPNVCGHLLMCQRILVEKGDTVRVSAGKLWSERQERKLPEGWEFVCAAIREGNAYYPMEEVPLGKQAFSEGRAASVEEAYSLKTAYKGELLFVYSIRKECSIDPMYPEIGDAYIRHFFGKFEEHFPGEGGRGLNFFFSDELDFGIRGNLWNAFFPEEFRKRQLTDAIARNFVMGHNLLSLHGFYYSTHGGFWEWAPPCNCVRVPYWKDMKCLTGAVERLSFILSQGVHSCHIGIVYPAAAVEGGIDGEKAVDTAFAVGEALYRQGIDFDFLDYESIQRAEEDVTGQAV